MPRRVKILLSATALSALLAPAAFADADAFQGFYGGFSMGLAMPDVNAIPFDADAALSGDVFIGYNHALNSQWIIGAELSYGASSGHDIPDLAPASFDIENLITLSGRVGYVFNDTMIYGRVGYQTGDMPINFAVGNPTVDGYMLGLGVEHMMAENVSIRFEVSQSYLDVSGTGVPPGTELDATRVSVGVAFHF